jgi:hypothetical protein
MATKVFLVDGNFYNIVVVNNKSCVVLPDEWLGWSASKTLRYLQ